MSDDASPPTGNDASTPAAEAGEPEANFLQFLSGMAIQTLMHLGEITNPVTNDKTIDLPNARYSIDLLAILQAKSEGNRTPEEDAYLKNALTDLRMRYVEVAGQDASGEAVPPADDAGEGGAEPTAS